MRYSAASKRARNYRAGGGEWFCGFSYTPVKGLGYEEGIHRRDPSSVIKVNDLYYVWYTKSCGPYFIRDARDVKISDPYAKKYPWDYADIWYATSLDGINWTEKDCAVHRGEEGAYDARTCCTPDVLEFNSKYYIVYQAVAYEPYMGNNERIAMAVAENPNGPWKKINHTILEPMESGYWFNEKDTYNDNKYKGVTHDPSLYYFNNKFYLYYKCCSVGPCKHSGHDHRWGVAISESITGIYKHSEFNPITNSGHETMLWKYKGGIAALLNRDGPEKDTIQYAKDGINFEVMAHVSGTPQAGGAFRTNDTDRCPLSGLNWGLCHCDERISLWNYIIRFDTYKRWSYTYSLSYPTGNDIVQL